MAASDMEFVIPRTYSFPRSTSSDDDEGAVYDVAYEKSRNSSDKEVGKGLSWTEGDAGESGVVGNDLQDRYIDGSLGDSLVGVDVRGFSLTLVDYTSG